MRAARSRIVSVQIYRNGPMYFIPVPFDPRAVFGKVRAPVRVTLNGYTYRSTLSSMDGICIPLRRSHLEAARLKGDEQLDVKIALDSAPRKVTPPADLARALARSRAKKARWDALSYSYQREYVEALTGAKKPETRARRLANTLEMLAGDGASR